MLTKEGHAVMQALLWIGERVREEMWACSLSCSCVRIMILKNPPSIFVLMVNLTSALSGCFPSVMSSQYNLRKEPWGHDCWWIIVLGCISLSGPTFSSNSFSTVLGAQGRLASSGEMNQEREHNSYTSTLTASSLRMAVILVLH